jgi:trimeric autotransporter adhesin
LGTSTIVSDGPASFNTAIGWHAGLANNVVGGGIHTYNTSFIGSEAGISGSPVQDNYVYIGNNSITNLISNGTYGSYSDKRIKENIKENVPGLSFINLLKPVTYNLNIHKQNTFGSLEGKDSTVNFPGKYNIEKITKTGFLAQDVEAAAKQIGYNFSGVTAPINDKGLYSIAYSDFVMPLVKATQELDASNKILQQQIDLLQQQNSLLLKRVEVLENKK